MLKSEMEVQRSGEMENREKSDIPHSNLLRAISEFYGSQAIAGPVRKEISANISEYGIPPNTAESLMYTLCTSFKLNGCKLHSQLSKARSRAALEYILLAKQISRELSFRKLKRTLNCWDTTIQHMRNNEQLMFPLNQSTLLTTDVESTSTFKVEMCKDLEKQQTDSFVNIGSQVKEHKFSITDAKELQKERAKFNARYSYMLAKAARHRKIKSKKYHKMIKHKQISCPESTATLKNSDPLQAELLESIEKKRAKERATLRHRNTGHWTQIRTRAKQNSERRKQLMQQMELNQNPSIAYSSEDEPEEEEKDNRQAVMTNPWIANPVILEGDTDIPNEKLELRLLSNKQDAPHCKRVQFEMHLEENVMKNDIPNNLLDESSNSNQLARDFNVPRLKRNETLNPDAFIKMKPQQFELKDSCILESSDNNTEGAERGINTINEAFSSDDIVAKFRKEKEYIQLENTDSSVPGWGKWSGNSSQVSARKQNQSAVKRNRVSFAKLGNKKDIILREDMTDKLKEQQVNEIPFSFTQMKDYEASIRFPIGSTWAPHTAHNKLVSPALITKLGTIIKPIQQDFL